MKTFSKALLLLFISAGYASAAEPKIDQSPEFYRSQVLRIRQMASFKVPSPVGDTEVTYSLKFAKPAVGYELPLTHILDWDRATPNTYYKLFWDRIFVEDGSTLKIKNEVLPVTCVYVDGQDNRKSGTDSPLFPNLVLKVYVVANDFDCEGPINRGFPSNGGREEAWDSYMFYMVKDPTIMMPVESKLRYRWNEFETVFFDRP